MGRYHFKVLLLLVFWGLLGLLAKGTVWGEWGAADIQNSLGYIFSAVISSGMIYVVILAISKLAICEKNKQSCTNK
jgi:hypothetical protein